MEKKDKKSFIVREKVDKFGFRQWYSKKEKQNPVMFKPNITKKKIIIIIIVSSLLLFFGSMAIISGIHSWKEFPGNPLWMKIIRTGTAVTFSPIYIFYVFLRALIFKQTAIVSTIPK